MTRSARITVSALAAGALAVLAGAGPVDASAPPRAQLRSFVCQRAVAPASRAVSVTSVMRPVSGTHSLQVRFELLRRMGNAAAYAPVSGSDLGRWIAPADRTLGSRAGDVWILNKPVVGLPAPAAYRFRVEFRWIGRRHHVIATTSRETGVCRQPELRPDLVVRRIGAPQPNKKGTLDVYPVTIGNRGDTAARAFTVGLATPGGPTSTIEVAGLAAHASTQLMLRGPLCAVAAPPSVTADLYSQVDDFDRGNNVATVSCTAATSPF